MLATDAGGGFGPSSMFARDKPCLHRTRKTCGAADAITMEGVGIRAAMKYKSKTFFSKLKSKALHLTADLREGEKSVFTKLQREFERHSRAAAERERGLEIERKMI